MGVHAKQESIGLGKQAVSIVILTDLHFGRHPEDFCLGSPVDLRDDNGSTGRLKARLLKHIDDQSPEVDLIIVCGDLVHDTSEGDRDKSKENADFKRSLRNFLGDLRGPEKKGGPPRSVHAIFGNHDLMASTVDMAEEAWRAVVDDEHFKVERLTKVSVGHNRLCEVFFIDNTWLAQGGDDGAWFRGAGREPYPVGVIADESLEWLDQQLARSNAKCQIVVSHFPLHYWVHSRDGDPLPGVQHQAKLHEQRARLHSILCRYPRAVLHLTGHTHENRITHGEGAVEVTTAAFSESPHVCRVIKVENDSGDSVSVELKSFVYDGDQFSPPNFASRVPADLGYSLGDSGDSSLSFVVPAESGDAWVRRQVQNQFFKAAEKFRCSLNENKTHSLWEGYLGSVLTHLVEARTAYTDDIRNLSTLYSVLLVAAFSIGGFALADTRRLVALGLMGVAGVICFVAVLVTDVVKRKAEASYAFYVSAAIHAAVVHEALKLKSTHLWVSYVNGRLGEVTEADAKRCYEFDVPRRSLFRSIRPVRSSPGFTPRPVNRGWLSEDWLESNWDRVVEMRWKDASAHGQRNNLYRVYGRLVFIGWIVACGFAVVSLLMVALALFFDVDWVKKPEASESQGGGEVSGNGSVGGGEVKSSAGPSGSASSVAEAGDESAKKISLDSVDQSDPASDDASVHGTIPEPGVATPTQVLPAATGDPAAQ